MSKIIIFLIIIGVIYFLFIKSNKKEIKTSNENEFVQCESCKTFVLKKEATEKNGKFYCKECDANT
jgi:uncharacterized protein